MGAVLHDLRAEIAQLRCALPLGASPPGGAAAAGVSGGAISRQASRPSDALRRMDSTAVLSKLEGIKSGLRAASENHFVDAGFPPAPRSLGDLDANRSQHRPSRVRALRWARAQELGGGAACDWSVFAEGGPRPGDVSQGMLGDCWFLSALAVLAERPEALRRVIFTRDVCKEGAYGVKLCKDGLWQAIVLDDYFPASSGQHARASAYSAQFVAISAALGRAARCRRCRLFPLLACFLFKQVAAFCRCCVCLLRGGGGGALERSCCVLLWHAASKQRPVRRAVPPLRQAASPSRRPSAHSCGCRLSRRPWPSCTEATPPSSPAASRRVRAMPGPGRMHGMAASPPPSSACRVLSAPAPAPAPCSRCGAARTCAHVAAPALADRRC